NRPLDAERDAADRGGPARAPIVGAVHRAVAYIADDRAALRLAVLCRHVLSLRRRRCLRGRLGLARRGLRRRSLTGRTRLGRRRRAARGGEPGERAGGGDRESLREVHADVLTMARIGLPSGHTPMTPKNI